MRREEKVEEPDHPKYRDRAKERREDQNPDYEPSELGSFHAVAPPGNVDLLSAEAQRISIEKSKYLGGDVEHTHLVKGLDYALLHKVRSEIDKKPETEDASDGKPRVSNGDHPVSFRTGNAKVVYQWIVKPQTAVKPNDMFLPGIMAFIFDMESGFSHDIPTTVYRSKAECPEPEVSLGSVTPFAHVNESAYWTILNISADVINSASSLTQMLSGDLADGQRKLVALALALAGANSESVNPPC
ncbi:hypothetical protein SSX86_030106 [Deinandra increscens subsp. villosa]|uniref:RED-like N-terminal domain-containing protein n=1 Tax=Deinandra increscens subsp. villosa TaxID=3103831 RepID=A0AAP0GM54_9ASTR